MAGRTPKKKSSELARRLATEDPEKESLRDALRRTQAELVRSKRRTAEIVNAIYRAAFDSAISYGAAKIPPKPPRDRRTRKPEVAVAHTTDWQVGKVTRTYNSEVAEQRLTVQMPNKIEELVELQRKAVPVREGHLLAGGDMVEGIQIFPGQAFLVDSTLFDQLFLSASILEKQILHMLRLFDAVHVWEEYGNHGRLGKKGENPAGDNLDRMMYRIVMERFRHEPRVAWHPVTDFYNHVVIGNYRALLVHGDEVKSFGGNTPAFGILRKVNGWKAALSREAPFWDCYMGHWHTPMTLVTADGGRIFVSGSPESDNEYAKEFVASTGDPSQRLNFVQPERGRVTAEYVMWLDGDVNTA